MFNAYGKQKYQNFKIFIFIYLGPRAFLRLRIYCKISHWSFTFVAPWRSGYHCCTASFNQAWTQVLRRFKPCSWRVGDSRWWGSLAMVPDGNEAKRFSSVNHTTKAIHHHHHHHQVTNGWIAGWWINNVVFYRNSIFTIF